MPPPYIGSRDAFAGNIYRGSSSSAETSLVPRPPQRSRNFPPHAGAPPANSNAMARAGSVGNGYPAEDGDQVRRQICDDCGSSFVSKAHLSIHRSTVHERQRVHICSYDNCGKTFGQRGSLSRHISAVHLRIRKHICQYDNCGKSFSERWTLQVHVVSMARSIVLCVRKQEDLPCTTFKCFKRNVTEGVNKLLTAFFIHPSLLYVWQRISATFTWL